ncbi:MAG: hypothetical protein RIQ79_848 [Verrucomicrobiota bacterium]
MALPQNEAFSRILIDKALEFSGWDLLGPEMGGILTNAAHPHMDTRLRPESEGFSPVAAARHVRLGAGAGLARGAGRGRVGAEKACLLDWLRHHDLLVEEDFLNQLRPVSSGAELVVYHDAARRLAIMAGEL